MNHRQNTWITNCHTGKIILIYLLIIIHSLLLGVELIHYTNKQNVYKTALYKINTFLTYTLVNESYLFFYFTLKAP